MFLNEAGDSFDVCYGKFMSWHFKVKLREVIHIHVFSLELA